MLMCPVYACKSPAINAQLPRGGRPCLFFDLLLQLNRSALSLRHVSVRPRNIWTSSSNIPSGNLMLLAPGNGPLLHVFQLIVSRQCINERHFLPKHVGYMELRRKHSSYTRPFSGQVRFLVQHGVQVATWRRQAPPTSSSVCSIASRNGPECPRNKRR